MSRQQSTKASMQTSQISRHLYLWHITGDEEEASVSVEPPHLDLQCLPSKSSFVYFQHNAILTGSFFLILQM